MKTAIWPLLAVVLVGLWWASPAQSQARGKSFHYDVAKPKPFKSEDRVRSWLNRYSGNGYILETDVVIVQQGAKEFHLVPVASLGRTDVPPLLIFRKENS